MDVVSKSLLREITQILNKLLPGYTNFQPYHINSGSGEYLLKILQKNNLNLNY